MTCIAAFVKRGVAYVGGDTAASSGSDITTRVSPKVFRSGDFILGCAGSFRQLQVLRYEFEPPPVPADCENIERFMVREFVGKLRACLRSHGVADMNGTVEHSDKCSALVVAWRGRVFEVEHDYNVGETADGIAVAGSGGYEARAALAAFKLSASDWPPEKWLEEALIISEQYTSDVRGPFTILNT